MNVIRYLRGWCLLVRAMYKMRTKKHGAGSGGRKAPWLLCWRMGTCVRSIIDGQYRTPPRFPRWMVKGSKQ